MAPASASSRHTPTSNGRRRGRPPGTTNAARAARQAALEAAMASEPPPKKRRYIPGGPGGGGRFVDADSDDGTPIARAATVSRPRAPRNNTNGTTPSVPLRRERSTRTRSFAAEDADDVQWGTAAAVAASVQQADDYKPREERGWEEFHPNLDIDGTFMVLSADEVDGVLPQEVPDTPIAQTPGTPLFGNTTPSRQVDSASASNTPTGQTRTEPNPFEASLATPTRRPRRLTRDIVSFYGTRGTDSFSTPKTPKILPIQNQTPKERLDLKLPSYRKTNRIELFESKTFGQARYVDRAMSNVGYQESDSFPRPERSLLKAVEGNADDESITNSPGTVDEGTHATRLLRVEYDMDEQDDMWLEQYNAQRKQHELEAITREVFEITMTGIEKEWHALERRIPKPNPKPPQTHRPRSSSAAAVNGESREGEEPDSKCAICDDGDCENTNAIVFCDGCNLAVHQECYGVPFIPEGQWMCRKCQLCGRGVPTCIFCPNTDGAFKQTNTSKWAHLLCAMWIPEVSLGNHTFMEPVMDVEKVPKTRWKLSCYICHQKMGACIQCSNKNCYQAFHVTCARRAKLYLKMKTSHGALAVLDGAMVLKAFCDRHCPPDYSKENSVHQATRVAKKFYKRNMRGRIWADNHAMANVLAARHRNTITEHPHDEAQMTAKNAAVGGDNKKVQPPKNVWKLPSGAPVIPQQVFEVVEASIQRFPFRKRKDYLSEACRYWTLKREARRGAALLKRLQLQMESFSSMELTRRNFAAMGPGGRQRLARRLEFAENLIKDLEQLKDLSDELVQRESLKLDAVELEQEFVDECYFPVAKVLAPAVEKAISLDKDVFSKAFSKLESRMQQRFYVTGLSFAQDFGNAISNGIATPFEPPKDTTQGAETIDASPAKGSFADIRERRKLGKRILKAIQPYIETALQIEAEISNRSYDTLHNELEAIMETSVEAKENISTGMIGAPAEDVEMTESIQHAGKVEESTTSQVDPEAMKIDATEDAPEDSGEVQPVDEDAAETDARAANDGANQDPAVNTSKLHGSAQAVDSQTPPDTNGTYTTIGRPVQADPPTPPQSNGSLGKASVDPLSEGGVLWHMKAFEPKGTSVLAEHWPGRDAIRMLSEDLTDMDDDELKGLGVDVDIPDAILTPADADEESGSSVANANKGRTGKNLNANTNANRKRRTSARRR